MDDFLPFAALSGLVVQVINFLKYLRARDWNGSLTTLTVWVAGVVGIFLAAESDYAASFDFGGVNLADMNSWTKLFVGLTVGAAGSAFVEVKKALDGNDSAAKPDLFTGGSEG